MSRTLKLACAALIGAATLAPNIASAQYGGGYGRDSYYDRAGYASDRRYYGERRAAYGRRGYDARAYDGRRYDNRTYGRCRDKGTGGTILGAIAGGLLGDAAVGRSGDRTMGALVGAGVGALAGRSIDRNC